MSFLDHFDDMHRNLFRSASTELELDRGHYLLRRGEPGGDIYLVQDGSLEVVDRRASPEVILAVLHPGAVVGEMAFLDDSPRSADVRAADSVTVRRWAKEDLRQLLHRQPILAAQFYEGVAREAADRMRALNTSAVTGGVAAGEGGNRAGLERTRHEVGRLTELTKEALLDAETRLRQDPADAAGRRGVTAALDHLQRELHHLFTNMPEPELAAEGARLLARELHPYLVRSALADRCIRRNQGVSGTAEVLAHVLVNRASGDGHLGELLDRWLLDRPTFQAFRDAGRTLVDIVHQHVPRHRNRRVLVLNAGTGSVVAALSARLADAPTVVTVVDQSREALAFLDAGVTLRPRKVELQTLQENLVEVALGRARHSFPPQDVILAHGLVEYMPDRIALSLLRATSRHLADGGCLVVTGLIASDDHHLLDRLLGWPSVRRRPERLVRLFQRAGLDPMRVEDGVGEPLLVVKARAVRSVARTLNPF